MQDEDKNGIPDSFIEFWGNVFSSEIPKDQSLSSLIGLVGFSLEKFAKDSLCLNETKLLSIKYMEVSAVFEKFSFELSKTYTDCCDKLPEEDRAILYQLLTWVEDCWDFYWQQGYIEPTN